MPSSDPLDLRTLFHGLLAGLAGTTVMQVSTRLEAVVRGRPDRPVDYDDCRVPMCVLEAVISHHFPDETERFVNEMTNSSTAPPQACSESGLAGASERRVSRSSPSHGAPSW